MGERLPPGTPDPGPEGSDHDDFVTDALLSSGGSGSPVFAVSCRTGEFELVGIFHSHYTGASALNLVVAIDQVRDLMTTMKRSKRASRRSPDLDAAARARLLEEVRHDPDPPFFSIGPLAASLWARSDGALVFAVFASDFPRTSAPLLQLSRALLGLRKSAAATFAYREALRTASVSRADVNRTAEKKRSLNRTLAAQRDAAQVIVDMVGRERSRATGPAIGILGVETGSASINAAINTSP